MIVCITWFVMCYNVVCLVISTWMSLENILENVLSCTVYKNCKRKQIFLKLFDYEVRKYFPKILQIERKKFEGNGEKNKYLQIYFSIMENEKKNDF